MSQPERTKIVDAVNALGHAMFHLRQAGDDPEIIAGRRSAGVALEHLRESLGDQVNASTAAIWMMEQPHNIKLGVTAHCSCGHVFVADVIAGGPTKVE